MKNIHLIETKIGQRITKTSKGKFLWCPVGATNFVETRRGYLGFHLYITSSEEIKEGDWYYRNYGNKDWISKDANDGHGMCDCKKIILTTDQDLIKDGVQAIDDEFLHWFVENTSCEEVEVERCPIEGRYSIDLRKYIQKEELKQETILREAAKNYRNNTGIPNEYKAFIAGTKWQAEKMYSEEEVRILINRVTEFFSHHEPDEWDEWIEKQFKKK